MSFDPHWYAAAMRNPSTDGSLSTFIILVKAMAWLVSRPMMPTFVSAFASAAATATSASMGAKGEDVRPLGAGS